MATYSNTSPWRNTRIIDNKYLGNFEIRPIPAEDDDFLYEV